MNNNLVNHFCTPPYNEITNFDLKSIANAEQTHLDFEQIQIPIYSWGEGEKVLLVHGWGSRASHMSLLARIISNAGFQVFTFDAPAHSSVTNNQQKATSSMFEFGRSISAVANHIGNIHTIVGHSIGALAALFTVTGYLKLEKHKFDSKKIVLISSPANVEQVISSFSKTNNLSEIEKDTLRNYLEMEFDFKISDYCVSKALINLEQELLVIHDEDDEEVSVSNAYVFKNSLLKTNLHVTNKLGHKKILLNREIGKYVVNYILA